MSNSDFPPSYDESKSLLVGSPMEEYPPPTYRYPAYGGQPQPVLYPPSYSGPHPAENAMYPPGLPAQPGTLFPGQPAMYPQPAGVPGQGYPIINIPPVTAPVTPPLMPALDDEAIVESSGWDSLNVRHAFIRKVYLILALQLLVTLSIVAVFTFVQPVRLFVSNNPSVYYASYVVYIVTHIVLVCCQGPRRHFPWNVVLLSIFTLAISYMTGTIASYYDTKAVFLALVITVVVCVIVTVFCFQTKVDFTACGGLFCVLAIVVTVTGIITVIVLSFKYIPWLHMLYAAIGAVVYTLFLAYHTQLLIGNRKYSISPEEYIFGALSLYIDIIQIFLFLLQIIGASSK